MNGLEAAREGGEVGEGEGEGVLEGGDEEVEGEGRGGQEDTLLNVVA